MRAAPAWRCRPGAARRPAAGRRRAAGARRPARPPRRRRGRARPRRPTGPRRGRRSSGPGCSSSARAAPTSGRPEVDAHLVGEQVQHPHVGQARRPAASTVPNGRGRPSQSRKVPAFSTAGATGSTTSACAVHVGGADLQADDETGRGQGGLAQRRVGQVVQADAADQGAAELAAGQRGEDRGGVAAGGGRQLRAPGGGDLVARRGRGDRTPAGQQRRQRARLDGAPLAGAPRHPGEPGLRGRAPARGPR